MIFESKELIPTNKISLPKSFLNIEQIKLKKEEKTLIVVYVIPNIELILSKLILKLMINDD